MAYSKQNFQDGQILTAANLEKMENGIIAGQGAHNLLDNSDFTNPVNQRGKTSYSGGEYAIDRWKNQSDTNMALMDGFIRITGSWDAQQILGNKLIGTYTYAIYAKVNVAGEYTQTIEIYENGSSIATSFCTTVGEWKIFTCTATFTGGTNPVVTINNRAGSVSDASIDVKWAALYEGAYTADTLPAYVPKGYAAELAECQRYYQQYNTSEMSAVGNSESGIIYIRCPLQVPMRTAPSLVQSSVEMWTTYSSTTNKTEVFTFYASNPQCVHLKCTSSTGSAYQLVIATNNAAMAFSADL